MFLSDHLSYGYRLPEQEASIFYVDVTFPGFGTNRQFTYPSCCLTMLGRNSTELPRKFRDDGTEAVKQFLIDLNRLIPRILDSEFCKIGSVLHMALDCLHPFKSIQTASSAMIQLATEHKQQSLIGSVKSNAESTEEPSDTSESNKPLKTPSIEEQRSTQWDDDELFLSAVQSIVNNCNMAFGDDTHESRTLNPRIFAQDNTPVEDERIIVNKEEEKEKQTFPNAMQERTDESTESITKLKENSINNDSSSVKRNPGVENVQRKFIAPKRVLQTSEECNLIHKIPKSSVYLSESTEQTELVNFIRRMHGSVLRVGMSKKRPTVVYSQLVKREP
ncbi:unnamed protein product [Echinostoma caproni]|uniref:DUF4708 domain-containing protein n=1 Tax=Echinostoma caproni TaxID=27848 RepID=A0A183AFT2_9TREM|nr:unnamed protein product [Echinostoma caproni]